MVELFVLHLRQNVVHGIVAVGVLVLVVVASCVVAVVVAVAVGEEQQCWRRRDVHVVEVAWMLQQWHPTHSCQDYDDDTQEVEHIAIAAAVADHVEEADDDGDDDMVMQ